MRIIFHTDDLRWHTGFGCQALNIALRLKRAKPDWEIAALHWNFRGSPFPDGNGILMLPDMGAGHFSNAQTFIQQFQPDVYFTLYDVFVSGAFMPPLSQKTGLMQDPPQERKTKWLSYYVWDVLRWSAPRAYQGIFNACDIPVAMSKFGQDTVLEAYSVEANMIYHGVDLTQFKPLPQEEIQARREAYGNPDFVMGAFFRNIHRKQTATLLEAWSRVSREYPDVRLLLNMRPDDPEGFDVTHYAHHFNMLGKVDKDGKVIDSGPLLGGQQISPTWGVPPQELNLLYQVCDAQILTTMGEGFGIPIIEGYAASGLPVIMSHNSTYDELVGDHGLPIECEGYMWSKHEGAQPIPKIESIEDQMRLIIDDVNLRKKFVERNKEFVKDFDFESKIIPQWIELLEKNVA